MNLFSDIFAQYGKVRVRSVVSLERFMKAKNAIFVTRKVEISTEDLRRIPDKTDAEVASMVQAFAESQMIDPESAHIETTLEKLVMRNLVFSLN